MPCGKPVDDMDSGSCEPPTFAIFDYQLLSQFESPPWSWLLVPAVPTKLLHPFHSFLTSSFCLLTLSTIFHSKNSPQYLRFQLPSYSLFLPNRPFSCIDLQHNSSSYTSSYSLRSPSDPACLPCAASRVGGGWDPGG